MVVLTLVPAIQAGKNGSAHRGEDTGATGARGMEISRGAASTMPAPLMPLAGRLEGARGKATRPLSRGPLLLLLVVVIRMAGLNRGQTAEAVAPDLEVVLAGDMGPRRNCPNSILRRPIPSLTRRKSKKKCSRYCSVSCSFLPLLTALVRSFNHFKGVSHTDGETGKEGEQASLSEKAYDKSTSFFDNISCESLVRLKESDSDGGNVRSERRRNERSLNAETFGRAANDRFQIPQTPGVRHWPCSKTPFLFKTRRPHRGAPRRYGSAPHQAHQAHQVSHGLHQVSDNRQTRGGPSARGGYAAVVRGSSAPQKRFVVKRHLALNLLLGPVLIS